jgi:hypothetical protein
LKKLLLCFILFTTPFLLRAQDSACALRIGLLTCAPGSDLYSIFGHTAIRVQNPEAGIDQVYNYGTFEFSPDFYRKFILGKLRYSLSVESYAGFLYTYQLESRSVVEQELLLSCADKEKLFAALQQNAREENRYYRYDFLFDNCTTRAGDIIEGSASPGVQYRNLLPPKPPTFRHLIHRYLDKGQQPWSKLGIDLLLGAPLDRRVSNEEMQFLPDNLLVAFDSATTGGRPLVTAPQPVLLLPSPIGEGPLLTPTLVFWLLALLTAVLTLLAPRRRLRFFRYFDPLLFALAGLAGAILIFMWLGTDHAVCANNYNLLWALPTHLLAAFWLRRGSRALSIYLWATAILCTVLLVTWSFLPQQLNTALIPLVLTLLIRSGYRAKTMKHGNPTHHAKR